MVHLVTGAPETTIVRICLLLYSDIKVPPTVTHTHTHTQTHTKPPRQEKDAERVCMLSKPSLSKYKLKKEKQSWYKALSLSLKV